MDIIKVTLFLFCGISSYLCAENSKLGNKLFKVEIDQVFNGNLLIEPTIPESGYLKVGSKLKLSAVPDADYSLDSIYYSFKTKKRNWITNIEEMSSPFEFEVTRDISIGASFIKNSQLKGFEVIHNVEYAKPGVKTLKYDVYKPEDAKDLPCIIIIHGGGWSHNSEDVMRGLARELVRSGEYVVCSVDYRWKNKADGDEEPNSIVDLIEDVYGAIAHIQEHAKDYGADATQLAVTGDSAGGHLSASVANMANTIGIRGFEKIPGVYEYKPTYLPKHKSIEQVRHDIMTSIKAAAPSYGVYGGKMIESHARGQSAEWAKAIAPIHTVPDVSKRWLPQFILRGTKDRLIKHEAVIDYVEVLKKKGQFVTYIEVEMAHHSFLDWKPDPKTKSNFYKYAVVNIAKMKHFFDGVFYQKRHLK